MYRMVSATYIVDSLLNLQTELRALHHKPTSTSVNTMAHPTLLGLPPELRLRIYDHIFSQPRTVMVTARFRGYPQELLYHSLTQTCRQLRVETQVLDYNTLEVGWYYDDVKAVISWLRVLGPLAISEVRWIGREFIGRRHAFDLAQKLYPRRGSVKLERSSQAPSWTADATMWQSIYDTLQAMALCLQRWDIMVDGRKPRYDNMIVSYELPESPAP